MGFIDAVKAFYGNYTNFQGRASRSEFWWAQLFLIIGYIVLAIPMGMGMGAAVEQAMSSGADFNPLSLYATPMAIPFALFGLINLIPSISLGVRRFHDRNQTGWLMLAVILLSLIPLLGLLVTIAYIVNFCLRGTVGDNKYGSDPLGGVAASGDVFS